jgi:hypothetical protein
VWAKQNQFSIMLKDRMPIFNRRPIYTIMTPIAPTRAKQKPIPLEIIPGPPMFFLELTIVVGIFYNLNTSFEIVG